LTRENGNPVTDDRAGNSRTVCYNTRLPGHETRWTDVDPRDRRLVSHARDGGHRRSQHPVRERVRSSGRTSKVRHPQSGSAR
jgi:hypothetical protein